MRIGVDVMGGDNAPDAVIDGAIAALEKLGTDDQVILIGDDRIIRSALESRGVTDARIEIVATTEVIGMSESPVDAVRTKKDSSLTVLGKLAGRKAEHPLDVILSAGNTGAEVTAAQMYMRRLPNVHRPGIAVAVPTFSGAVVLIDAGANIDPKPSHLMQYGVMGAIYAERFLGIDNPRVGLMNVGSEEAKGTPEMRDARDRLRNADGVNFIGYVEGRGVFEGEADVVVTDGLVGNVMLKLAEGLSQGIFRAIGREVAETEPDLAPRLQGIFQRIHARHDYHEHGGAPLLGVNGICLICHGSSEARTITSAIVRGKKFAELGINEEIVKRLGALEGVVV